VESCPRLLELDLPGIGYHSMDVDDFFRPLGATVPAVNGGYSMRCYEQSLEAAFLDHCSRSGQEPVQALQETDFFVLHTPFHAMPEMAMQKLLANRLALSPDQASAFLGARGFYQAIEPLSRIGNMYTASMYAALAFLLEDRFHVMGDAIVGKRILLASYGSGNTMIVLSARVAEEAPGVIARWDLGRVFADARAASFEEYEGWVEGADRHAALTPVLDKSPLPPDAFFLAGIRKDGYREYGKTDGRESWTRRSEESIDAREPIAAMG
jgi:hydroxymethylglutaryl-CoA synthase